MNYSLQDIVGLITATALGVPVLLLPGFAIAYAVDFCGFRKVDPARRLLTAVLVATAIVPVIAALSARMAGVGAAVAVTLVLAMLGALLARRQPRPAISRAAWTVSAIWFVVVAATWIDIDTGQHLHVSLLVVDMVKHAATVRVISDTGMVPPADVFYLRDQASSYYYYYFLVSAMIERLGFGLVDARMAVAGQLVWTGIAVLALAALLFEHTRSHRRQNDRAPTIAAPLGLLSFLFCVGGLQLLFVLLRLVINGQRLPQVTAALGEPVTPFMPALLWVPHHVSGVLAAWCAFLALIQAMPVAGVPAPMGETLRRNWALMAFAAAALASAAGLTIWVTLGAVATAAVWAAILVLERRWTAFALLAATGLGALCLSAPDLLDMVHNRHGQQAALGMFVRPMALTELISWVVRLFAGDGALAVLEHPLYSSMQIALNPFSYFVEAGVFFVGAVAFWRARHAGGTWFRGETDRLLFVSAVVTLVLSTFIQSTVLNNDFGWRVPMYWQLAAFVWTAYVLLPLWQRTLQRFAARDSWTAATGSLRQIPTSIALILALGVSAVAYDIVGMRLYPVLGTDDLRQTEFDTDVIHDLRTAHTWLGRNVSPQAITQHNPEGHRALGFGLYGHQQVAFADKHNGTIFGASREMVRARFDVLAPVFAGTLDVTEVKARLVSEKVDYVIVTSLDKPWQSNAPWVFATTPAFSNGHVRVLDVSRLQAAYAKAR